ncbi:Ti-type conjugative transfer relaxase TraA [Roseomonas mucosa]|uniref:Ti-type conjugative transfer relaxase TraA n=1 Tax=Roseomonas mucosa TaxID=207340 RepID=UPI001EF4389C|nr:Ti-type conjugative transfer relaxase TraA [Roseomonas mucosa]MCG7352160.1 Ti-type conjugative transfer relaxase TraA [Roseomonas mucosa]MCG7357490.1 Ti-type conjugative transfer relaxase TraA [Roseomonas mucosa]MDT8295449.1 Ti-type conjugative transfer relaxase TraA [Roseomonas mucosa]
MAIYHFSARVIGRGQGRSVVAAAAYRSGTRLRDERLGQGFDYTGKAGVVHSEILLPEDAPRHWSAPSGEAQRVARAALWNAVEAAERRKDSQLARDIELALPRELSRAEAIRLARDFVAEQFVARGMVADLNVHWGQAADGSAQPHAHVLLTMRRIAGEGFGRKEVAWNDRALLRGWRERWAELANERLAEAGHDRRIDHRSLAAQGLELAPQNKIGPAGARREARGEAAERAAEHRAIARANGERLLAEPALALRALTAQQSTFTRAELARLVHRQSDGAGQFAAVMARVEASPELVRVGQDGRGRERFSTREMVGIEQALIAAAVALNRRTTHRVAERRRLAAVDGTGAVLSEEQSLAFLHLTRSRDLAVVVGIAGGGKSTMLGAARQAWEGEGYRVRGAALSGIAAEGLEGSAGIGSRTLASWEHAWDRERDLLTSRDVLVVDEAGMIGSRQLGRLVERVRRAGAKLVLVGDAEQLQAIEAGAAFRAIADRVGAVAITEPRRQREAWQRLATRELATARTAAALDRYAAAGLVERHRTREAARAGVIAAWQAGRRERPEESRIILAHEREDVRALNEAARAMRRQAGELGPDRLLPTGAGPLALAEGERVYFLRNERGLGVKNGTLGTVTRIAGARLTVRLDGPEGAGTGREVGFGLEEYADLGHGYAATIHKSQGVTVDRAYVLATPGMDRHLAYVALSRHRQAARLHWSEEDFGETEGLRERLGRERAKDTTLDYDMAEPDPVAAYAAWRGLAPLAPASGIVVRRPEREAGHRPALPEAARQAVARIMRGEDAGGAPVPSPAAPTPAPRAVAWPWQRVPAEAATPAPLLPAVAHPPIAGTDVAAAVEAAPEVLAARSSLSFLLERAYREPEQARVRLAGIGREWGLDAMARQLKEQPELLGRLRGREGFLASTDQVVERRAAIRAAGQIGEALTGLRRAEAEADQRYRTAEGDKRHAQAVAVPGLSARAMAAIEALREVGQGAEMSLLQRRGEGLAEREVAQGPRAVAIWRAIVAEASLSAELEAFRAAAVQRLASGADPLDPVVRRVDDLAGVLQQSQAVVRHHVMVKRHEAEAEKAKAAARQRAAGEAKPVRIPRPRSRPSPGPGTG